MHVWVDGQCFQTASRDRGIGRYVWELLKAMRESEDAPRISLSLNAAESHSAIVARTALSTLLDPADIHVWESPVRGSEMLEGHGRGRRLAETALAHHVNCIAPDVALSAAPFEDDVAVPYLPSRAVGAAQACIFYDAIPYRFPDRYFTHPGFKKAFLRRLDALDGFDLALCISDFSCRELVDIHPGTKAISISAGISGNIGRIIATPPEQQSSLLAREGLNEGYVLYVGANDWRKNIRAIIDAYAMLPPDLVRRHPLVLAGASDDTNYRRDRLAWSLAGLPRDGLINLGQVSDEGLVELYRGASVLVQPSLMEGFGLPSLEALTVGTLVLAADAGAVPEVVRAPELRFDPHEPEELATKLRGMLEEPAAFATPLGKAREAISDLTWANTARTALGAMHDLLAEHRSRDRDSERAERRQQDGTKAALSLARRAALDAMHDSIRVDPRTPRAMTLAEIPDSERPRLLIDTTYICGIDHRTGIQRVVRQSVEHMMRDHPRDVTNTCTTPHGVLLDAGGRLAVPPDEEVRRLRPHRGDTMLMLDSSWNEITTQLPRLQEHRLRGGKVVFCLYDVVVLRAYGFSSASMAPVFVRWFRYALMYATGFMCISRAVADELMDLLAAIDCPRRIEVGYWQLGADLPAAEPSRFKSWLAEGARARNGASKGGASKGSAGNGSAGKGSASESGASMSGVATSRARSSFVMVGTMEPRKGYTVALDAFDLLWEAGEDVELTIVGKVGWASEHTMERIKTHPELGKRLTWHAKVSDEELARHYAAASALVSASFAEGFGLPLVEAGRYGKPAIASDIPVFREVAKGASGATFFEVGDAEALADAVRSFVANGPDHPPAAGGIDWPDWKESAQQLYHKVTAGEWYRTHEPRNRSLFEPLSRVGDVQMESNLASDEMDIDMEVVEGPIPRADGIGEDYLVSVHNPTSRVWSSEVAPSASGPVNLSWKRLHPETLETIQEGHRDTIPFVLYPGDTHYVRFVLPLHAERDALLRFDAVQENVSWFRLRD